jgi:hypothetical protein
MFHRDGDSVAGSPRTPYHGEARISNIGSDSLRDSVGRTTSSSAPGLARPLSQLGI